MTHTPLELQFARQLAELQSQVDALARSQQLVFTDPTGATGDPANGHAVVVIGSLKQICGISAFGIASYKTGSWVQL